MKFNALKRTPLIIAAVIIVLACVVQIWPPEAVERFERMTYDWRVRVGAKHSPLVSTNLGFVSVNDESIAQVNRGLVADAPYGLYWPRHVYARAVRELRTDGARAVAFDVLFAELRRDHAPIPMGDGSLKESDQYFADIVHGAGNVLVASERGIIPPTLFRTNALGIGDISADKDLDGVLRRARAFRTYRKWHIAFQQVENDPDYGVDLRNAIVTSSKIILPRTQELKPIEVPLDKNGDFDLAGFYGDKIPKRMARQAKPFTEERVWHMGIMLAAQELKLDLNNAKVELDKGRITVSGANGIQRVIPVDEDGSFYINWALTTEDDRVAREPIEALLSLDRMRLTGQTNDLAKFWQGKVDWHNKLVMIGSEATGNDLSDRGATPLQKDTLLVSEHWNIANSMLTGQFVQRSSMPMQLALIAIMVVIAALLTPAFRSYIATFWVLVAMVAYVAMAAFVYVRFRYWMPVAVPIVGSLLTTHVSLLAYLIIFEQAERRRLRSVFTKVVSQDVVAELETMDVAKMSLGGARRNVTVLFADIRGFTEMTDVGREKAEDYIKDNKLTGAEAETVRDASARETLATVNLYLTIVAESVLKHKGTVDKFIGDCVMAFWGAPIANSKHALCCVQAAIEAQRSIYRLNQEREAENRRREAENIKLAEAGLPLLSPIPILVLGSGINTGVVTVGLMGSQQMLNYTVFGRDVNLASRLESVSGRGRIIISEATLAEMIQDDPSLALACKELPPEKVKGFRLPVKIYEVPWLEAQAVTAIDETTPQAFSGEDNTGYFKKDPGPA